MIESQSDTCSLKPSTVAPFTALLAKCFELGDWSALREWVKTHDVDGAATGDGHRPLEMAIALDDVGATRELLALGADASALYTSGTRPLHLAALMRSCEIVTLLLAHGADVNGVDEDRVSFLGQTVSIATPGGRTPLHIAAEKSDDDVMRLLLDAGADVLARDFDGASPLDLCDESLVLGGVRSSAERRAQLAAARAHLLAATLTALSPTSPSAAALELPSLAAIDERRRAREQSLRQRTHRAKASAQQRRIADNLAVVAARYVPLDPTLFVAAPDADADADAVAASACHVGSPSFGVLALPLLDAARCASLARELAHYEALAPQLALPLFYRHDDNLGSLERCGFAPLLERLTALVAPLLRRLVPSSTAAQTLRARHAFLTRNAPGRRQTTEVANFKLHRDKSAVTLNVCIERSADVRGSEVAFYRAPPASAAVETPSEDDVEVVYEHALGQCVLHTGAHWHRTRPIVVGARSSLIVWCDIVDK